MARTYATTFLASDDEIQVNHDHDGIDVRMGPVNVWMSWDQLEALSDKAMRTLQTKPTEQAA